MDDSNVETYLARLTSPGISAIATLSLFGPRAWEIIFKVFKPRTKKPLPILPTPGSVFLGRLGLGHGDEVVLSCKTNSPMLLEIHPHGGTQVVSMLLEFLQERKILLWVMLSLEYLYQDIWILIRLCLQDIR